MPISILMVLMISSAPFTNAPLTSIYIDSSAIGLCPGVTKYGVSLDVSMLTVYSPVALNVIFFVTVTVESVCVSVSVSAPVPKSTTLLPDVERLLDCSAYCEDCEWHTTASSLLLSLNLVYYNRQNSTFCSLRPHPIHLGMIK